MGVDVAVGVTAGPPVGRVVAVSDGSLDLVALHESQIGLVLYIACGKTPLTFTELKPFLVHSVVTRGQRYNLLVIDFDDDRDADILFTRSLLDDLIIFENKLLP